jgi:hypothetical protein
LALRQSKYKPKQKTKKEPAQLSFFGLNHAVKLLNRLKIDFFLCVAKGIVQLQKLLVHLLGFSQILIR